MHESINERNLEHFWKMGWSLNLQMVGVFSYSNNIHSSITPFGFPDPIPMCMSGGGGFPHTTPSKSQTPAGCLKTQLNSDTNCPETVSDSPA